MVLPLIIGAIEGAEMVAGAAEVGGIAAEGGAVVAESAAARGGGIINKLIGAEEVNEIGKTVRSIFGKNKSDDQKDNKENNKDVGVTQEQSTGTYAGSTSKNSNSNINDIDRKIASQESLLRGGFWFGKNNKPGQREVDDAMKGNVAGFVVTKLVAIDNKISRLDERMLGITKILSEHLVLERERLAEIEIDQQESGLKLPSGVSKLYNGALGTAKSAGKSMLDTLLPFLIVGFAPMIKDLFDKIMKWTWAQTDRFLAGVSVAARFLIKAMDGISAFATRTANTLLGKLTPFKGSVSVVSQVSEEEKELRGVFDSFYAQSRGEFGQGAKQAAKSAQRALLRNVVLKDPKKYNEAFKKMYGETYKSGVPGAPAEDEILIKEADSMGVKLAKFAGRASIKISAKATRFLSYLIPLRKFLAPIAKYVKFLVFLDPLIALFKCGAGDADIAEVKTSFVRALGAFIGGELGAMGGAAAGAALFGILGSIFPVVGNIIGAVGGGIIGGFIGGLGGSYAGEWIAEKIWQLMGGEKTPEEVQADAINEAKTKTKEGANGISNTTQSVGKDTPTGTSGVIPGRADAPASEGKTIREGNPYDVVFGFGKYGSTDEAYKKKLSQMTISEVNDFQLKVLRKRAPHGSTPVGAYQIINSTLIEQAKEVFGDKWKSTVFNKENQDKIAGHLFDQTNARGRSSAGWSGAGERGLRKWDQNTARSIRRQETGMEKGSSPRYTEKTSYDKTMPTPRAMKQTQLAQSQQYGIPSPFASTSYDDRVSVFFNANEPMMGVGMST